MKPQLVIPMTGISSRFTAAGYTLPKFLLEVDGQTVIEHVLDMFPGWEDVVFCCNEMHLDDASLNLENLLLTRRPKASIVRVSNNTKGPGWAVLQAEPLIDKTRPVVVNYCDFTCFWDSNDIADVLSSGQVDGCIPAYTGFHPHMGFSTSYAYLKISDTTVTDIQEKKPWTDNPHTEYASSGTYGFATGQKLFDSLHAQVSEDINLNGEYYLSLTYKPLLEAGGKVSVLPIQHFMQWGTPQDFEEYKDVSHAIERWSVPRAGQQTSKLKMSKVILASGAGKRFSDAGYTVPKPALSLGGKSLLEHSLLAIPGDSTVIVTRTDLPDRGVVGEVASKYTTSTLVLPGMTRGQAESALLGIAALAEDCAVTVGACDSLIGVETAQVEKSVSEAGGEGLVVWVSNRYHVANRKPEQYGWVKASQDGTITKSWVKEQPDIDGASVITGTFTFGSRKFAIEVIEKLLEENITVNGEFYLDSVVQRQIDSGKPCVALELPSFVSVGTPLEYESALYWQSCFDKWALHPYKVKNDPTIDQAHVMTLSHTFRNFD